MTVSMLVSVRIFCSMSIAEVELQCESKKQRHPTHVDNFTKY